MPFENKAEQQDGKPLRLSFYMFRTTGILEKEGHLVSRRQVDVDDASHGEKSETETKKIDELIPFQDTEKI